MYEVIFSIDCESAGGEIASREDNEYEEYDDNYDQIDDHVATRKGHDDDDNDGEYDEYDTPKDYGM